MASSKVDLPEPFSPTNNVTRGPSGSGGSVATAGTVKGKPASSWWGDFLAMRLRCGISLPWRFAWTGLGA